MNKNTAHCNSLSQNITEITEVDEFSKGELLLTFMPGLSLVQLVSYFAFIFISLLTLFSLWECPDFPVFVIFQLSF